MNFLVFNEHNFIFFKSPKIGKKVKIQVEGNADWTNHKFYIVVVGRSAIAYSQKYDPTDDEIEDHKLYLEFEANSQMAPSASVIVYYIHPSGEIIYDRTQINLDLLMKNNVRIKNMKGRLQIMLPYQQSLPKQF